MGAEGHSCGFIQDTAASTKGKTWETRLGQVVSLALSHPRYESMRQLHVYSIAALPSFNKGNTEGTNSLKMCFIFVYTRMLYVCVGIGFVD